ncbi:hypothetical protein [Paenibacillus macerans]|uniref:hypothetical protein n=1 Tax=Paenibacillus macerans TaxID=44252 RepID=UPI003D31C7D9
MMYTNNLDIAKQHIEDLRKELERYRLVEQIRRRQKEAAKSKRTAAPVMKPSVMDSILAKMRRLL